MSEFRVARLLLLFLVALFLPACYEEKIESTPDIEDVSSYVIVGCGLSETLSLLEISAGRRFNFWNNVQQTCQSISQMAVKGEEIYGLCSLSNSLIIYDEADLSIIDEHALGERKNPISFCFDDDGRIWISNFVSETVEVYKLLGSELTLLKSFDLSGAVSPGRSRPGGIVCAGSKVLAVLSNLDEDFLPAGDSAVAVFDAGVLERIGVSKISGRDAVAAAFRREDGLVYVTCAGNYEQEKGFVGDGKLVAFDPKTQAELWSMDIAGAPFEIVIWRNFAFMGNGKEGKILVADIEGRVPIDPIDIRSDDGSELSYASALAIVNSDLLVAAEFNHDKLFVFDLSKKAMLADFSTCDGPDALAVLE